MTELSWRKSSRSASNGGDCVELAVGTPEHILVRDSKDPGGPALAFGTVAFQRFLTAIKRADAAGSVIGGGP